ncbi:AMP-binding protein [Alkalihalobacterium alkalinitrilicum]|uniref:AMP-binding protein n=1 Tax=Alkalihalobacterium alkalinitrilicum TaxID=427920 RepID=UPI000995ADF8|nr:AMP-binding protein [Alkalihalobacterium alkalinitrilicum]
MTIGKTIPFTVHSCSSKISVVCDDDQLTYKELYENIQSMQQQLVTTLEHPYQKKVAFLLENDVDFLILFLAISEIGAIAIPLDPKWSNDDLQHIISDCTPDVLITTQQIKTQNILTFSLEQLKQQPKTPIPNYETSESDIFYIGYTSGTTGKPKGYLRTHSSWLHSFTGSEQVFKLNKDDLIFSPGPLVHSHFLYAAVHSLHIGATLYVTKKFSAHSVYQTLTAVPITVLYLVPTMFSALDNVYKDGNPSITRLEKVISAGAKWQVPLKNKARQLVPNAEVFEFYGASELSFVSVLDHNGNSENPESVGHPFPGVQVSIRRSDGTETDYGEIGKLFIKSKQMFSGYLNNPDATKEVFHGEWATVGDLAFMDTNGYITLVGREKNMIISGGLNIYPEEVEKVLCLLPEVAEVAVFGIEDLYWGEKVIAAIQWKDGKPLSQLQLKQYCKQKLAAYKCPQMLIEIDAFPYTTSGKIARKELIKLVQPKLEHQRM